LVDWKLTKREELLLRMVLALPYASSTGLACTIWSSSDPFFCKHIQTYIDSQWLQTKPTYSVQYEYRITLVSRNAPNLRAVITCHVDKKKWNRRVTKWVSGWVGLNVLHQLGIRHLGDDSLQSITCTGTDIQIRTTKIQNTKENHKITNMIKVDPVKTYKTHSNEI